MYTLVATQTQKKYLGKWVFCCDQARTQVNEYSVVTSAYTGEWGKILMKQYPSKELSYRAFSLFILNGCKAHLH